MFGIMEHGKKRVDTALDQVFKDFDQKFDTLKTVVSGKSEKPEDEVVSDFQEYPNRD